jgi:TatD DNase family protein
MIIDTHAHLYYENLIGEIENILQRAYESGITKVIVPAVDLKTSEIILNLAERYEMIFAAVGFHPCDVKVKDLKEVKHLEDFIHHKKTVAIGEIGLDYFWDKSYNDLQKKFFCTQAELAADAGLPVIIHTRDSIKDAISSLKELNLSELSGQFHCFSGDENDLKEVLSFENFYLSYCGNITYKKYSGLDVVKNTPVEKLLAETDSPFLTPEPYRGKPNEPARIIYSLMKISEVKQIDLDNLKSEIYKNTKSLFKKVN